MKDILLAYIIVAALTFFWGWYKSWYLWEDSKLDGFKSMLYFLAACFLVSISWPFLLALGLYKQLNQLLSDDNT